MVKFAKVCLCLVLFIINTIIYVSINDDYK